MAVGQEEENAKEIHGEGEEHVGGVHWVGEQQVDGHGHGGVIHEL